MKKVLWLILFLSLVRGVCYVIQIPPWQSPDEVNHFIIVRELYKNGFVSLQLADPDRLVLEEVNKSMEEFYFNEISPNTPVLPNKEERPPLYYIIAFGFLKLLNIEGLITQFYFCRVLSLVFGIATIWITYIASSLVFENNTKTPVLAALLVSLIPQFTMISSSVNPDSLVNFLCSLFLMLMIKIVLEKYNNRTTLFSAIVLFLALLAKRASFVLIPIWLFIALMLKKDKKIFAVIGIACIGALFFTKTLFPNVLVNILDPAKELVLAFQKKSPPPGGWVKFNEHIFVSFFGVFGWLKFPFPGIYYYLIALPIAVLIILLIYSFLTNTLVTQKQKLFSSVFSPINLMLCVFLIITYITIFIVYGVRYHTPAQGRYLFPAIIPLIILLISGLNQLKAGNILLSLLALILLLTDSMAIFQYVFSSFHFFLPSFHSFLPS